MFQRRVLLICAALIAFGFATAIEAVADTNLVVTITTAADDDTPVENAFVEVRDTKGNLLASGYTNKKGIFRWHFKGTNEGTVWHISAKKVDEVALVAVSPMNKKTAVTFPIIDD